MNDIDVRLALEREYHESEDFLRDGSGLIVGVYASGIFDEAKRYHLDVLGDLSGAEVLDYGCGTGGSTRELEKRGARVTAFDISLPRLRAASDRATVNDSQKSTQFTQCAAERLPYKDESFDFVIGKQILHHLELDPEVTEVRRVLRPGGKASFLEPLIHNPILEGYRRLTPQLRSPTEKALSYRELERMGSYFSGMQRKEFILLSVLPVIAAAATGQRPIWDSLQKQLGEVERHLIDMFPAIGRYCWEVVVVFDR